MTWDYAAWQAGTTPNPPAKPAGYDAGTATPCAILAYIRDNIDWLVNLYTVNLQAINDIITAEAANPTHTGQLEPAQFETPLKVVEIPLLPAGSLMTLAWDDAYNPASSAQFVMRRRGFFFSMTWSDHMEFSRQYFSKYLTYLNALSSNAHSAYTAHPCP